MTSDNRCPIRDFSLEARKNYVNKHQWQIELVISEALEEFPKEPISTVFGTQNKAIPEIIKRFLVDEFKPIDGLPRDITLFTQLHFWIKHKTGRRVSSRSNRLVRDDNHSGDVETGYQSDHERYLNRIASRLVQFNRRVAPDVIDYWLMANKKLLDEIAVDELCQANRDFLHESSGANKSRYKADASFRFLYLYLGIKDKIKNLHYFEGKYLTKGKNKPQYTSGRQETHKEKSEARKEISLIINKLVDIHSDTDDVVTLSLLKSSGKKTLLGLYEFNETEIDRNQLGEKIKRLSKIPEHLVEES